MDAPAPLIRYHQILTAVSGAVGGLSLNDLGRRTGLPRSSAHRIASALCAVGYLELEPRTGTYSFGPALRQLIRSSLTADNRLRAFESALDLLVSELNETAFFARLMDNGEVQLVKAVAPPDSERSYIYPGTGPRPLDRCSSSKAILAFLDAGQIRNHYRAGALPGVDRTPFSLEQFLAHLREVAQQGYAVCDGEIDEGVYSLAVPVSVGPILGLYSIGVVGPAARLKAQPIDHLVDRIRAAAEVAQRNLLNDVSTDR